MTVLRVFGSGGDFSVDSETGLPLEKLPEAYNFVTKFDVPEYRKWAEKNKIEDSDTIDVLCIGYWYHSDGKDGYEPAEEDYRKIQTEGWPRPIIADETLGQLLGVV